MVEDVGGSGKDVGAEGWANPCNDAQIETREATTKSSVEDTNQEHIGALIGTDLEMERQMELGRRRPGQWL
jgi:hypothetical protein